MQQSKDQNNKFDGTKNDQDCNATVLRFLNVETEQEQESGHDHYSEIEKRQISPQQKMQEQLMLKLIEGSWAAIALGEATAKAMQRIPDAHCNGDMHAALDYAAEVKHKQKEFLAECGIHSILDSGAAA